MFNNGMGRFGLFGTIEDLLLLVQNLSTEVISARVRTRALLELLEEKGVLGPGEFDERSAQIWDRDYDELSEELLSSPEPATTTPEN